jgi:hypothetical protein
MKKHITHLDYMILKYIPMYPIERSRAEIIRLIKQEMPERYKNLTTSVFDGVLLKYTTLFPLTEDKDVCDNIIFNDMEDDADCLHATMQPIPLEWVHDNIGMILWEESEESDVEIMQAFLANIPQYL